MEEQRKERVIKWKQLLNYQAIGRQIPFFLFLAALAVVYIYNGHYADRTIRNITRSGRELKDLQSEYKSVKGEALLNSRQSGIVEAVQPLGLKQLTAEPVVLVDSTATDSN